MVRNTYWELEVKVYDFLLDMVGQWIADDQLEIPLDDEIVKVLVDV